MSEDELEHLKGKVEELEKKIESIVYVTNLTNEIFKSLFEKMVMDTQEIVSLLEKLPENIAKVAIEKLKKDLRESKEILEKAHKKSYVV
jgi:bacterioferritin (cytochrome b1)